MSHIRTLPSGSFQAIVRLPESQWFIRPNGKVERYVRHTESIRRAAQAWADATEVDLRRGQWRDDRRGMTTVAEWRAQWEPSRMVERPTRDKDEVHWRLRIAPKWGATPLAEVSRLGVKRWVQAMLAADVGRPTIAGTVHHLGAVMSGAIEESLIDVNPVHGVKLPRVDSSADHRPFDDGEVAAILAELDEPYRTMVALDMRVGLRFGELAGLDIAAVDFDRAELHVRQVIERRDRTPRERPKSRKSDRTVPIGADLLAPLARLAGDRTEGLIFLGPQGGPLADGHFRARVWRPALARAGVAYRPPHTMRHTAASALVEAGVDLLRVQELLGHESYRVTEKYAHLAPNAHDVIREAWARDDARIMHASDQLRELDR